MVNSYVMSFQLDKATDGHIQLTRSTDVALQVSLQGTSETLVYACSAYILFSRVLDMASCTS